MTQRNMYLPALGSSISPIDVSLTADSGFVRVAPFIKAEPMRVAVITPLPDKTQFGLFRQPEKSIKPIFIDFPDAYSFSLSMLSQGLKLNQVFFSNFDFSIH